MINTTSDAQAILDRERAALDKWAQGRAAQYYEGWADDVTYFDDIGAQRRIDGLEALRTYGASLDGKVPPHRYELLDPKVQMMDDVAIVTLGYHPFGPDGAALQRWKATLVYRRIDGDWRVVHGHWSMVKQP
jgi:ketosteroid isomerase-like protein